MGKVFEKALGPQLGQAACQVSGLGILAELSAASASHKPVKEVRRTERDQYLCFGFGFFCCIYSLEGGQRLYYYTSLTN